MSNKRRARILAHIVSEYVSTALPVGSQTIVRKYGLPISPATVRHEMAKLEEEGYVTHPHTSAGRIPSDKGYRYYVESLMEEEDLPWVEKRAIQDRLYRMTGGRVQFRDEHVRLVATLLAETVRNAAVATAPRSARCRLQHLELVALGGGRVLLVVVFAGACVRQRVMGIVGEADQDDLTPMANRLGETYAGLTLEQMTEREETLSPVEMQIGEAVAELMADEEQATYDEAYLDGLRHVLSQPEFSQTDTILDLLGALQEGNLPKAIPFDVLSGGEVSVVIGAENQDDVMRRCSVVLTRYGVPGEATGALAVLGPTRMQYSRVIPTVRYLSSLMGELVAQC